MEGSYIYKVEKQYNLYIKLIEICNTNRTKLMMYKENKPHNKYIIKLIHPKQTYPNDG